jgi:hypothetical protein
MSRCPWGCKSTRSISQFSRFHSARYADIGKVQDRQTTGSKECIDEGDREDVDGIVLNKISEVILSQCAMMLTWQ